MSCIMQSPIISQIQIQKWILYHVNRIMLWVTHIDIHKRVIYNNVLKLLFRNSSVDLKKL